MIEILGLTGELRGLLALVRQRLLSLRLALLAFFDEEGEAVAIVRQHEQVAGEAVALLGELLAQAHELVEIDGQRLRLMAHLRQDRPQHHRRAHGLQRVLGAEHDAGGRLPAHALQRRQHFGDGVAPFRQRCPQRLLPVVERADALVRLRDLVLHATDAGRGVDDLLIELAPVVADRLDLALEPCLVLGRLALLGAQRLELLVALLDRIETGGWRREGAARLARQRVRRLRRGRDQPKRHDSQHRRDR